MNIYIYVKSHVFCLYFQGLEQAHTFCIYLFLLTLHSRYFLILYTRFCFRFFSVVVNLVEMQVQFLGQEGSQEKEMVTHPSFLAWEIPWSEEPGRLQSTGSERFGHD